MGKFLLLLILLPFVELFLLLQVADVLGPLPTLALLLLAGFIGAAVARREGFRVVRTWQQTVAQGRVPEEGLLGAALVLVGGLLLLVPGFLSDVVGVLLLLPPTRRLVAGYVRRRVDASIRAGNVRVTTVNGEGFTGFSGSAKPGAGAGAGGEANPSGEAWDRLRSGTRTKRLESDADLVDE